MVAHEAGIKKFQNNFRQRMVYSRNLDTKVYRCNEISVSIVKNVETNFLTKKDKYECVSSLHNKVNTNS